MNVKALGLIETIGFTTAVSAADAAVKAADVEIIGLEKVIGVRGYVGVTINLSGDVAAVSSAVEAGREKAKAVGEVISTEVIPRAHSDVDEKLINKFSLNDTSKPTSIKPKKHPNKRNKPKKHLKNNKLKNLGGSQQRKKKAQLKKSLLLQARRKKAKYATTN